MGMTTKSNDLIELYTWTEVDVEGEGTIACVVRGMEYLGMINLVTRSRAIAEGPFAAAAKLHHERTGHRVRLVCWNNRIDLRDWDAK